MLVVLLAAQLGQHGLQNYVVILKIKISRPIIGPDIYNSLLRVCEKINQEGFRKCAQVWKEEILRCCLALSSFVITWKEAIIYLVDGETKTSQTTSTWGIWLVAEQWSGQAWLGTLAKGTQFKLSTLCFLLYHFAYWCLEVFVF